jgi:hypothetical protein
MKRTMKPIFEDNGMTLTITLAPEIETRLKNRAAANGYREINEYAKKIIEDHTNQTNTLDEIFAPFRDHTETISEDRIESLVNRARSEYFDEKRFS